MKYNTTVNYYFDVIENYHKNFIFILLKHFEDEENYCECSKISNAILLFNKKYGVELRLTKYYIEAPFGEHKLLDEKYFEYEKNNYLEPFLLNLDTNYIKL